MFSRLFASNASRLLNACGSGDYKTVVSLFKKDPSLANYHDTYGQSALSIAAECGHRYIVEYLLQNKVNPNYSGPGDPAKSVQHPLITASFNAQESCVTALLEAGADANAVSAFGTPLEMVSQRLKIEPGSYEVCASLFRHSKTPLVYRTDKEMSQQHTPEEIKAIHLGMAQIQKTMKHMCSQMNLTFRRVTTSQHTKRKRSSRRATTGSNGKRSKRSHKTSSTPRRKK